MGGGEVLWLYRSEKRKKKFESFRKSKERREKREQREERVNEKKREIFGRNERREKKIKRNISYRVGSKEIGFLIFTKYTVAFQK